MTHTNPDSNELSVLIFSFNSEHEIDECINSAHLLSSSCIVIDLESGDETTKIAAKKGAKIITHPFTNYVETVRDFAIQQATSKWVFILDADERITSELADEVKTAISSNEYDYYKIPRKEFFRRKIWLKHGGWWPNYQIRLIKHSSFRHWPKIIHSTPQIDGNQGYLKSPLIHYSKNDYEEIVNKTINFEDIESELLFKANKPVSTITFFRKFLGELYRRLFKNQGYKDGTVGVIESLYQAFSKTITYIYLYEKKNRRTL